jgi:hypothetical protein
METNYTRIREVETSKLWLNSTPINFQLLCFCEEKKNPHNTQQNGLPFLTADVTTSLFQQACPQLC